MSNLPNINQNRETLTSVSEYIVMNQLPERPTNLNRQVAQTNALGLQVQKGVQNGSVVYYIKPQVQNGLCQGCFNIKINCVCVFVIR